VDTAPTLRTTMLQLDQAGRGGPNPFQDRRVHKAANLAVDMDAVIKNALSGLGDRVATVVNPMAFGFDPIVKPYKQDLLQAKRLLTEAGYPNGFDFNFLAGPPAAELGLPKTTDAILADLAKVGLRAKPRNLDFTTLHYLCRRST
jgi:peptide/nickel transport system substrate-binding protein